MLIPFFMIPSSIFFQPPPFLSLLLSSSPWFLSSDGDDVGPIYISCCSAFTLLWMALWLHYHGSMLTLSAQNTHTHAYKQVCTRLEARASQELPTPLRPFMTCKCQRQAGAPIRLPWKPSTLSVCVLGSVTVFRKEWLILMGKRTSEQTPHI